MLQGGSAVKTGIAVAAIVLGFMFGLELVAKFLPSLATTAQGNLIAQ